MESVYKTSQLDWSIQEIAERRIAQICAVLNLNPGYFETPNDALQTALDVVSDAVDRLKAHNAEERYDPA